MKFKFYLYFIFFFIIINNQVIKSQIPTLSDSSKISLLTNSPWNEEIYALFGHTAIRINDSVNGIDVAFNYGIFDFDSPNFIFRFIKGETDYFVGAINFKDYLYEYKSKGVGVTEQILNLTQDEKQKIFNALVINSLPQNREYRYNYFYDNCSTRPRDIIQNNINGVIEYQPTSRYSSYRDLVHQQVNCKPWVKFGIDLVIGSGADKIINDKQKDFLPSYLEHSFESAKIINTSDSIRSLVIQTNTVLTGNSKKDYKTELIYSPFFVGIEILCIAILISIIFFKNRIVVGKIFDTVLFLVAGFGGCIIFFLMFFSEHPCTNPNWNIVWLNPLQFIFAFLFWIKSAIKYSFYYHFINFVVLTVFLLAWFLIPQSLEIAFIPYILTLWIRSGVNILQYRKYNRV